MINFCQVSSKKLWAGPVCNPLHLPVLGEGHKTALELGWISSWLIDKIQLPFPSHDVLCQHLAAAAQRYAQQKAYASQCSAGCRWVGWCRAGCCWGRLSMGQAAAEQAINNNNERYLCRCSARYRNEINARRETTALGHVSLHVRKASEKTHRFLFLKSPASLRHV